MACTHPVLYSRNCVLYCQVCGSVIDPPVEKPQERATEAATNDSERVKKPRRRTKKEAAK